MFRHTVAGLVALLFLAGAALAADKEVQGKVVEVDIKNNKLTIQTDDGKKVYEINDETKFLGPKGGASEAGLKDDRLEKGNDVKLVIAGNNRTVREVHLPVRKQDKDK